MSGKLGEIFYDGRIISLDSADDITLRKIFDDYKMNIAESKEKIDGILEEMRG